MDFERMLLFFFSALGAFNGLFLSVYFAFFVKQRDRTTYFLAALLFVVSVRVGKSVFLIFYPGISSLFVQIGLSACFLIGPFLYLYIKTSVKPERYQRAEWLWHVVPVIFAMILIGYYTPYREYRYLWKRMMGGVYGWILFSYWLLYVVAAIHLIWPLVSKAFVRREGVSDKELWLLSLVGGNAIIWLGYNTSQYTSYIFGALSFSFVFYLMILLWFFRRRRASLFFDQRERYANRRIAEQEALDIGTRLEGLFMREEVYKKPDLKLAEVADQLEIPAHLLSQYLNDNLGKSFTHFINEYRIQAVERMLKDNGHLTLEAIGAECGFRSNSSFYAAFKKFKGLTPAKYRKSIL
ncbi:MAG: helix-turn-helix domain-containing protein [Saprospiraceae bacterium]|nr:helix-turn-helix domain-containing protein [Saprospiraceae bacterium]